MNNILFICTDLGSRIEFLKKTLHQNPNIHLFDTFINYNSFESIDRLRSRVHRKNDALSIYGDILRYNYSLSFKPLAKIVKFIFFIDDPSISLNRIKEKGYNDETALTYYRFRLRGMYEWYLKSKGNNVLFRGQEDIVTLSDFLDYPFVYESVFCDVKSNLIAQQLYQKYLKLIQKEM